MVCPEQGGVLSPQICSPATECVSTEVKQKICPGYRSLTNINTLSLLVNEYLARYCIVQFHIALHPVLWEHNNIQHNLKIQDSEPMREAGVTPTSVFIPEGLSGCPVVRV